MISQKFLSFQDFNLWSFHTSNIPNVKIVSTLIFQSWFKSSLALCPKFFYCPILSIQYPISLQILSGHFDQMDSAILFQLARRIPTLDNWKNYDFSQLKRQYVWQWETTQSNSITTTKIFSVCLAVACCLWFQHCFQNGCVQIF